MYFEFRPIMLVFAMIVGAFSAYYAYKKGKNPYLWFTIGFLFGIVGVFAFFFASMGKEKKKMEKKPRPVFRIDGPLDKLWYYFDRTDQTQQGPMSHDALTRAWKEGRIGLSTYVWHEELPDWKPLKETLKADQTTTTL